MQCRAFKYHVLKWTLLFILCGALIGQVHVKASKVSKSQLGKILNGHYLFITALLKDNGSIIDNWTRELHKVTKQVKPLCRKVFISILENNDSADKTGEKLVTFKKELDKEGTPNWIVTEKIIHRQSWDDRISYLTRLRNKALEPLKSLHWDAQRTKILFFNDIWYEADDIFSLLATNQGKYDMACALDYFYRFYDDWVTRDVYGAHLLPFYPHFKDGKDRQAQRNGEAVQVFSCWNGVVAMNGSMFLDNQSLQFRTSSPTEPFHSECFWICKDFWQKGRTQIFINPQVKVAYQPGWYFFHNYVAPLFVNIFFEGWYWLQRLLRMVKDDPEVKIKSFKDII